MYTLPEVVRGGRRESARGESNPLRYFIKQLALRTENAEGLILLLTSTETNAIGSNICRSSISWGKDIQLIQKMPEITKNEKQKKMYVKS